MPGGCTISVQAVMNFDGYSFRSKVRGYLSSGLQSEFAGAVILCRMKQ